MTLRHLKIFTAVAECGSFTVAANKLYLAQPAVSTAIKELENYYGVRLFERLSKRIYITDEGKKLLSYSIHITSMFDELEQSLKNSDTSGTLSVGASITIGTLFIPQIIKSFKISFPDVNVSAQINSSDEIENKILKNELDLALIEGIVHSDYIIAKKFMDDNLTAVVNPLHKLANAKNITLDVFLNEPLLLREHGSGTRELFDNAVTDCGKICVPSWESTSTEALINGVICGNGVSVLPHRLVLPYIENGQLAAVDISGLSLKRSFYAVHHKNKFISKIMSEFLNLAVNYNM